MISTRVKSKETSIQIISLIDIVFLLLVFFIYAMLSMTEVKTLNITLPEALTKESLNERQINAVTVDKDGNYYINGESALLSDIENLFISNTKKTAVFADKNTPFDNVVKILDLARKHNARDISVSVK